MWQMISQKDSTCGDGCCSPKSKGKSICPRCGVEAKGVLAKTLDALLVDEVKEDNRSLEGWHFCKTATCEVIYFKGTLVLDQADVGIEVGCKAWASPFVVCYCFGWSREKIKDEISREGKSIVQSDIKTKMAEVGCSCEILNPSGGCCLGDVAQVVKEIKKEIGV